MGEITKIKKQKTKKNPIQKFQLHFVEEGYLVI
jgi:hypothetical protein